MRVKVPGLNPSRVKGVLKNQKNFLLKAIAVVLFVFGFMIRSTPRPNSSAPEQPTEVVTYSTNEPEEKKPDESFQWHGNANDPKLISLPSIGTEGFLQNVGIDQNRQIAVPNNVHLAGWFVDSVRPGQKGLSIIDGHVDGRVAEGVFKRLVDLKKDDTFSVEFGDGSKKDFKVMQLTTVATKDAASALFSQSPRTTNQLNLITCTGVFDRGSQSYDQRVIVAATLVH